MANETLYEIALTNPQGKRLLVSYANKTPSNSRMATVIRSNWARLERALGCDILTFERKAPGKAPYALRPTAHRTDAVNWTVAYTGRTLRDAKSEGELPWIGDLK